MIAARTLQMPSGEQVFLDRQILEDPPSFEHLGNAAAHDLVRCQTVEPSTVEFNRAPRHLTALCLQDSGDRLQRGRFPSAISAEQGRNRPLFGAERDALEHEDDIIVDDLDIVDGQHHGLSAAFWSDRASGTVGPGQWVIRQPSITVPRPQDSPGTNPSL